MNAANLFAVVSALGLATLAGAAGCKRQEQPASAPSPAQRHLIVAASADLKFAFEELAAEFHKRHPDVDVRATYGSSGAFFAQLANKAPFDMFLSADVEYPRRLVAQGLAAKETEFLYGVGRLVVWAPRSSSLALDKLGVAALLDPSVKKIALANPRGAPYGRAAEAALKKLGAYDKVADRLVLGENVAQAAQFVQSGSADVGLVALSLALAPALKDAGRYWPIPLEAYPRMDQGGVVLSWCREKDAADQLCRFITSADGKAILEKYGFSRPGE